MASGTSDWPLHVLDCGDRLDAKHSPERSIVLLFYHQICYIFERYASTQGMQELVSTTQVSISRTEHGTVPGAEAASAPDRLWLLVQCMLLLCDYRCCTGIVVVVCLVLEAAPCALMRVSTCNTRSPHVDITPACSFASTVSCASDAFITLRIVREEVCRDSSSGSNSESLTAVTDQPVLGTCSGTVFCPGTETLQPALRPVAGSTPSAAASSSVSPSPPSNSCSSSSSSSSSSASYKHALFLRWLLSQFGGDIRQQRQHEEVASIPNFSNREESDPHQPLRCTRRNQTTT